MGVEKIESGEIKLTQDGGVSKTILCAGASDAESPSDSMEAIVHYVGTLLDGTQFDSNRASGEPFKFNVGAGEVIKAWDIAIKSMTKGEKSLVYCAPDYAYGEEGHGEKIPPASTLKFELELLGFDFPALTSDGSIRKETLLKGEMYPTPNDGAVCQVVIEGRVRASDTVFLESGQREIAILDENDPSGLNTILKKTSKGEKARYFIYPGEHHFSLGKMPIGVAESDCLQYTVEMISFVKKKEVYEMEDSEKLSEGISSRLKGNEYFKSGDFKKAEKKYEFAISCLEDITGVFGEFKASDPLLEDYGASEEFAKKSDPLVDDDEQTAAAKEAIVASLNNMNIIKMRAKQYGDVITNSDKIIRLDGHNVKALYKRAVAKKELGHYAEALADIDKALAEERDNALLKKTRFEVKKLKKDEEISVNSMYKKMFDGVARK